MNTGNDVACMSNPQAWRLQEQTRGVRFKTVPWSTNTWEGDLVLLKIQNKPHKKNSCITIYYFGEFSLFIQDLIDAMQK